MRDSTPVLCFFRSDALRLVIDVSQNARMSEDIEHRDAPVIGRGAIDIHSTLRIAVCRKKNDRIRYVP